MRLTEELLTVQDNLERLELALREYCDMQTADKHRGTILEYFIDTVEDSIRRVRCCDECVVDNSVNNLWVECV